MMSGYSTDLRKRVLALREKGETQARIGELLGMSISTVKRYLVRYAQTGSVAATVQERMKPLLGGTELAIIEAQLEAHDDWTLPKHVEAFAVQSGLRVSAMTMSRAIKRLGWTRKKRRWVRGNATRSNDGYSLT
jgi:transposase